MSDAAAHAPVSDAAPGNWVDRRAPESWRAYLRLMRADRPIGVWLLLLPGWQAIALAAAATGEPVSLRLLALFAIGAVAMRGAGCAVNDIVDRKIDAEVARTRSRPLPSGQISVRQALVFTAGLCLVGLVVLVQLTPLAIGLGVAALGLIAAYPFMKRVMALPQAWLGLNMSYGALMGWASVTGELSPAAWALYAAGILWTIGYDTIYACQDKEDDALLGVGSSALFFGERARTAVAALYAGAVALYVAAGVLAEPGPAWYGPIAVFAFHLHRQVRLTDLADAASCLAAFRSNRDAGVVLFAGALLAAFIA